MNERIKKITNSKIFLVGIIILFMILIAATGTYAWLTWSSGENSTKLTMTIGDMADVSFTSGNNITTGLTPVFNYTDGESTTFSVKTKTSDGSSYNVKLNITSIDSELANDESVKYALVKNGELVANESLKDVTSGSSISIYNTSFEVGTTSYIFYLYIDGNMENNSNMIGKTISGKLTIELVEPTKLVDHITSLYTNYSNKVTTTNNSINYYYADIYDKDTDDQTSGGLMNDRLGGTTESLDGGNIRYYGYNPNNYIDIGDVNKNEEPILYRIIGLFKDVELESGSKQNLIKVVREYPIDYFSWDSSSYSINNGDGINEWTQADLMKLLNPEYENNTGLDMDGNTIIVNNSLYYNSGKGNCYQNEGNLTTSVDFTNSGLSPNVHNLIPSVKWNLGGFSSSNLFSNDIYISERGTNVIQNPSDGIERKYVWLGKVALMYPSDYGYATDFTQCKNTNLTNYNSTGCYDNDWMYEMMVYGFFLTPTSSNSYAVWFVDYDGDLIYWDASQAGVVMPSFYLRSDLAIEDGHAGTKGDPYKIIAS